MTERKTKPRSRAQINAEGPALLPRHIERIKKLRVALEESQRKAAMFDAEGDATRAQAHRVKIGTMQAELDGRLAAIAQIKKDLESIEA